MSYYKNYKGEFNPYVSNYTYPQAHILISNPYQTLNFKKYNKFDYYRTYIGYYPKNKFTERTNNKKQFTKNNLNYDNSFLEYEKKLTFALLDYKLDLEFESYLKEIDFKRRQDLGKI
jgi:hypothetical protein